MKDITWLHSRFPHFADRYYLDAEGVFILVGVVVCVVRNELLRRLVSEGIACRQHVNQNALVDIHTTWSYTQLYYNNSEHALRFIYDPHYHAQIYPNVYSQTS